MRIGILGGTMDPVHSGHIAIAQLVRRTLELDEMILLPAGDPPHKTASVDKWHRLEMVRLAAEQAQMKCSDVEVQREKTTYTVDTLTEFTAAHPNDEVVYVVGGDTVYVIEQWRDFPRVARMCTFAVVARPGDVALEREMEAVSRRTGARFVQVPGEGPDISSTMIRQRAAANESLSGLVPEPVAKYIAENRLYHRWTAEEMSEQLKRMIPPRRFIHSIGVMETAVRLAPVAGADGEKARVAGLLHDCAKKLNREQMLEAARMGGVSLLPDELENEAVLHAPAGAFVARHVFGVSDPEILSAIRLHTVGAPGMTPLEALIYVADFIEPNRKPIPGLEAIRAAAETDVFRAAAMCGESTRRYVASQGLPFCRQTQAMLDFYEQKTDQQITEGFSK